MTTRSAMQDLRQKKKKKNKHQIAKKGIFIVILATLSLS